MLEIRNLSVQAEDKQILQDNNLQIKEGEVHVLLGPNGSGKSSLAQTIMGNPHYQVTQGRIIFTGKDITDLPMPKRAKLGLALSFQNPPEIKGVILKKLLALISDNISENTETQKADETKLGQRLLEREVNVSFSGGEKKMSELRQIIAMNPKLVIFDELDSGLDLKNIHRVLAVIKKQLIDKGVSVLFITHSGDMLDGIQPDWTHVMLDKQMICHSRDYQQVITTIRQHGYQKCRHCQQRQPLDR